MCKVSQGCVFAWLRFWPTLCVCGAVGDFGFRDFGIGQENSVRPSAVHRPIGRLCIWLTLLLCLITTRTFTYWFLANLSNPLRCPSNPFLPIAGLSARLCCFNVVQVQLTAGGRWVALTGMGGMGGVGWLRWMGRWVRLTVK